MSAGDANKWTAILDILLMVFSRILKDSVGFNVVVSFIILV